MILMEIAMLYVLLSIGAPTWVYVVFFAGALLHGVFGALKE